MCRAENPMGVLTPCLWFYPPMSSLRLRARHSLVPFPSVYVHQHLIAKAASCPKLTSHNQPQARNIDFNPKHCGKVISPSASVKMFFSWGEWGSGSLRAHVPLFNSSVTTTKGFIFYPSAFAVKAYFGAMEATN